jgi:signal transduction histidine kinase
VLTLTGRRRALSPGVDLTAFRIIQEALTNCLKHAGPARALVSVDFGDRLLSLVVTDDGRGVIPSPTPGDPTSGGHGLIGMRERVAVFGGSLWAGPRRGGGYDVIAQLPLGREDEGLRAVAAMADTALPDTALADAVPALAEARS